LARILENARPVTTGTIFMSPELIKTGISYVPQIGGVYSDLSVPIMFDANGCSDVKVESEQTLPSLIRAISGYRTRRTNSLNGFLEDSKNSRASLRALRARGGTYSR